MRQLIILLIAITLWGCNPNKKSAEPYKSDWNQAKTAFSELNKVLLNEHGQTWNYSLEGPLMLVNCDTRTIIANQGDDSCQLTSHDGLFIGSLPEKINIANTAFNWNGKRWTMIALPLPETKAEQLDLLIHESFHRIQPAIHFDSISEIQSVHLETKEGRIYLRLELEALKKALNSNNPLPHVKHALQFRAYRHQQFPDAKNAENSLEINEGIAEYTGAILSQRNDLEMANHFASQIEWFYTLPSFVRSFPYFTIPIYGYVMNQTDPKWNQKITKNSNLTDFMNDFFKMTPVDQNKVDIMLLGKRYRIDSIIKNENERETEKIELTKFYTKKFIADSVVEIELEQMNIGFNPTNIVPLDSFGTVYPNLRITDNWGILEVESGGALLSPQWNKVTVANQKTITDSLITGEGWKLKLNTLWGLEISNRKFRLVKKQIDY